MLDYRIINLTCTTQSVNSLHNHLNYIFPTLQSLPEMLTLNLDFANIENSSLRESHLKLFCISVLNILQQSKNQIDVLFVFDDFNILHKECLAVLGNSGHQVHMYKS